jgi:hypothetical protein
MLVFAQFDSDLCGSLVSRMKPFRESSLTERNMSANIVKRQYYIGISSESEIHNVSIPEDGLCWRSVRLESMRLTKLDRLLPDSR